MSTSSTEDTIQLPQLPAAYELIYLEQVDCLRETVSAMANADADEGSLLWANEQKNARARLNKHWICNRGDLHCSIVLKPDFDSADFYQMLIVASVSLGNAIAMHVSPMTALGYQWPNDITIANHKVASIWLDQGKSNGQRWLALTLSVNVLNAPDDQQINAISIRENEGKTDLTNQQLLESFAREFIKQINNWSDRGYSYIFDQWRMRIENIGQDICLDDGKHSITGTMIRLDELGNVELDSEGQTRKLTIQKYMELNE